MSLDIIELRFKDERTVYMEKEDLANHNGPLMLTPDHYLNTDGELSWAYMFDGVIKRYYEVLGTVDDLTLPNEIVQ